MSPKRHAGPRTVDSSHMPENAASAASTSSITSIGAAPSSNSSVSWTIWWSTRDVFDGRNSPTVAASATNARSRDTRARVAAASSWSSSDTGPRCVTASSSTLPRQRRTDRSASAMRVAQRPDSYVASVGSGAPPAGDGAHACGRSPRPARRPAPPRRARRRHASAPTTARSTCGSAGAAITASGRRVPDHPHVLGEVRRRRARIVARRQHPSVATRHHHHAVGAGDGVQPHHHGGVDQLAAPEHRHLGEAGAPRGRVEALPARAVCRASAAAAAHADARATSSSTPDAVGVGEHHPAVGHRHEQTGHAHAAGRADLDRVGVVVLDPPVHDVDRVEPTERAQPQTILAHHEIGSFDQREAEQPGERRVLDVAGVVDTAGEQHDARARHVRVGDQRVAQLGREPGQRGDVAELLGAEQLVGDAEHRRTIEQGVAEPGRRVGEVLHDAPRAVGQLDDVDRRTS